MLIGGGLRQNGMTRSVFRGAGLAPLNQSGWRDAGRRKNRLVGAGMQDRRAAVPNGYLPPRAWLLPLVSGGLSTSNVNGSVAVSAVVAGGRNGSAALTGSGVVDAVGALISACIAALTGSGVVAGADVRALLSADAALLGSAVLSGSVDALGWVVGTLTGSGALALTPYATGELGAAIVPAGQEGVLSPAQIADAVWDAATAAHAAAGSMGEAQVVVGGGGFGGGQFWP